MSTESQFLVSVNANTGIQLEQTVAIEGVQAWSDCQHRLKSLPTHLAGGTLVRFPYRSVPRNTSLVVSVAGSDARLYLATEASFPGSPSNIDGDLARRLATTSGWLSEGCSLTHEDQHVGSASDVQIACGVTHDCPKLAMFSVLAQRGVPVALPTIVKQDTIVVLVAVPISCDSFAVAISSNSSASYERMVVVEEGVTAWNNRDHRYVDVPSCLLNGILFQGPYKDVPEGTTLTVRPNARARVFVIVERSCSGQLHEGLAARGWQPEEYAPRWHGMPTMAMFGHDCSAGAAVTLPPTQSNAAVFSVVVTPVAVAVVAPVEVSCVSTRATASSFGRLEPVPLSENTIAWHGEADPLVNVPGWMLGATLFRGPRVGLVGGSVFSVRAAAPSVVYVIVEDQLDGAAGRSGGLLPNALLEDKWERRQEAPTWISSSKLAVYGRRVAAREVLATPQMEESDSKGSVVAFVVKVDIDAFDAAVHTNNGLEYGRSKMMETACAWSDCANIYTWVPTYTNGGILFNGPHDSTPQGTRVRVIATGACRVYVIVEASYKGGQARHGGFLSSLPADGWQPESAPPSWGDSNSAMKVFSKMAPEGDDLRLPPTTGQVVFSVVVMSIASSTDSIVEELRRTFKAWDPDGKGGIQRGDLEVLLTALCPGLDAKGKDAMLKSIDRNKRGVIAYEELIKELIVAT